MFVTRDQLIDCAWTILKIGIALLILRAISILAGYRGYVPVIDEIYNTLLDMLINFASMGRELAPRF